MTHIPPRLRLSPSYLARLHSNLASANPRSAFVPYERWKPARYLMSVQGEMSSGDGGKRALEIEFSAHPHQPDVPRARVYLLRAFSHKLRFYLPAPYCQGIAAKANEVSTLRDMAG